MSFIHGSQGRLYANGFDMSAFLKNVSTSYEIETHDITTFSATAKSYLAGLEDATLTAEGLFSGSAAASDIVFHNALRTRSPGVWIHLPAGDVDGAFGYGLSAVETSYEIESPVDDLVSVSVEVQSNVGREYIQILHPLLARTATANGASRDNAALTSLGGVGYLQVTGVTGTTPDLAVRIQHSVDNSVWVDLVTFSPVTAANNAQRISIVGTVNRWTRAIWTITGTTPNITFFVAFGRY